MVKGKIIYSIILLAGYPYAIHSPRKLHELMSCAPLHEAINGAIERFKKVAGAVRAQLPKEPSAKSKAKAKAKAKNASQV